MSTTDSTNKTAPKWFNGSYEEYRAYMRELASRPHRRNFDKSPEGRKRASKAGKLGAAKMHND